MSKSQAILILTEAVEWYANPRNWEPNTPELNAHERKWTVAEEALERVRKVTEC